MNARAMLTVGVVWGAAACGADAPEAEPGEATIDQQAMDAAAEAARPTPEEEAAAAPLPPAPETMAVRTEEAAPVEAAPEPTRYDRLYTVQVAAYLDRAEAEELAGLLRGRGLPIWVTQATVGGRSWTRVRIGASPNLGETRDLGSWITRAYDSAVWVAPVDQAVESVPTGAVEQTRDFLSRR